MNVAKQSLLKRTSFKRKRRRRRGEEEGEEEEKEEGRRRRRGIREKKNKYRGCTSDATTSWSLIVLGVPKKVVFCQFSALSRLPRMEIFL